MSNISAILWQEQVTFDEKIMMHALVLAHWNNNPQVDMLLHSDTLSQVDMLLHSDTLS